MKKSSSDRHFKTIFDSMADLIALCNKDFKIIESNRSADVVLGKGKSIVGSYCYEMFRNKDKPCQDCPLSETIESGSIIPINTYDERFGEYFEERLHPRMSDNGNFDNFILVSNNITKTMEIEDKKIQSTSLAALGRISTGVAHDFNNVLTGVLARVQLVKRQKNVNKKLLKNIEMIETAALDGAEKVKRIQNFARLGQDEEFKQIDLKDLLEEVVALTRPKWKDEAEIKGLLIKLVLELSENLYILGNPSDLRNAFTNIIINDVDAMPDGGVLTVTSERQNHTAVVKFKDTGTGMTPETLAKVFDPFFSTKGLGGTGLGMSEVYGVLERHNGKIEVESEIGRGTLITLVLPTVEKASADSAVVETFKTPPCKILLIDDEDYILEALEELLTDFGHQVDASSAVRESLDKFKEVDYDMLITDLGMPEMSGWKVAESAKEIKENTPVVLLTGWAFNIDRKKIKKNGVDFVINKPFSPEEIDRTIHDAKKLKEKWKTNVAV